MQPAKTGGGRYSEKHRVTPAKIKGTAANKSAEPVSKGKSP